MDIIDLIPDLCYCIFMSQEVIIVGGVANKPANLAPFMLLGSLLSEAAGPHYVDGAPVHKDTLQVTNPTEQFERTDAIVAAAPDTDFLIVSHSLGSVAAVKTVAKHPSRTRGVLIAPPLPTPIDTYRHPHGQSKIRVIDGRRVIPSYSFALGDDGPSDVLPTPAEIVIPDSFVDDLMQHSETFQDEMKGLATKGLLRLVVPSQDWNETALDVTRSMDGVITLDATHSLQASPGEIERNCRYIVQEIRKGDT